MRKFLIALLVALVLLAVDRYSYGQVGGEPLVAPTYPWQVVVAVTLAVLIALAIVLGMRSNAELAMRVLLIEALGFSIYNAILISRDGVDRVLAGFEHSALGGLALIGGLACRVLALLALRAARASQQERLATH